MIMVSNAEDAMSTSMDTEANQRFTSIQGGLGVRQPISFSSSQGIIAMMLIFQMAYVATIGPLYYTIIAEVPASRLRDKTVRVGATVNIVTM